MTGRWAWIGAVLGIAAPLLGAAAGDDKDDPRSDCSGEACAPPWEGDYFCGNDCEPIEVKSLSDYDALLWGLEDGAILEPWPGLDGGAIPQLWEGSTGIISWEPDLRNQLVQVSWGEVFTKFEAGRWVESWLVYKPDLAMRTEPTLPYLGQGRLFEALPTYQALPDAAEYRLLTFEFRYLCPPGPTKIAELPTEVPRFVTDVLTYKVFFRDNGQPEVEAGALYRERIDLPPGHDDPPGVYWQDTWALWDTFALPDPGALLSGSRDVRLEATPWQGQTVRTFLQQQLFWLPGRCVVRTKSPEAPL